MKVVMVRFPFLAFAICMAIMSLDCQKIALADQIQLSVILPKLQAIHEDSKVLLQKNAELKSKILLGLESQISNQIGEIKMSNSNQPLKQQAMLHEHQVNPQKDQPIDYFELEGFNRWVEVSLDYAVKNTRASIDTLKEEAQNNNGAVDYSDQAIKDGVEGVKYWQSAVIFQDKTLKNERFDSE